MNNNLHRCSWVVLLLTVLAVAACVDHGDGGNQQLTLSENLKAEHVAPFTPEEVPSIQGNRMHQLHFAGGAHCGECHPSDQPMPIEQAHKICANCHPQRQVTKPVWENHCLACHYFTQAAQEYNKDPEKMVEFLCAKCHFGEGLGGSIYTLSGHKTSEMIICDHCHRPHDSEAPAAAELCATCHEDLADVTHPAGGQAKCSICHRAHRPPPDGTKLCTTCHGQREDIPVLVHQIPTHPKDCLKCHNAHFTTIEIKGVCVDCHEGVVYNGSENQPSAHKDCENCHRLEDFKFRGFSTCAGCHKAEGAVIQDDRVPSKHKRCATCHLPHTWRASFDRNCVSCHEIENVFEHQLPMHPKDCETCHDPHHTADMPPSGNCADCHDVPSFGTQANEMHRTCENCHPNVDQQDYTFAGTENSCQICHAEALGDPPLTWSDVPGGHLMCTACHATHSWKIQPVADSCAICHAEIRGQAPNDTHADCFNCHAHNHSVQFAGQESSCALCHVDLPGTHSAAGHTDCFNCHQQHSFGADTSLCVVCHADKAEGHYPDNPCIDCHTFTE